MAAPIKPGHKAIHAYYEALKAYAGQQVEYEGALETARRGGFSGRDGASRRG